MRQKYFISREDVKNKLNIKEYAITQRVLKNVAPSMTDTETFSFLGEETYDGSIVKSSIHRGLDAVIATLRTRNLFPIRPYAIKIAESVMALYASKGDSSVELFFDDIDLFDQNALLESG